MPRKTYYLSRQHGLSLVEVMIAMTVGLLLVLGLGTLLVNSSRSFKSHDEFARMQDNGAYALNTLSNDLRTAEYFGYLLTRDLERYPENLAPNVDCGTDWALNYDQGVYGYHGLTATQAHANLACIDQSNFIAGSPILILRGVGGAQADVTQLLTNTLYVQSDPYKGIVFRGGDWAAMPEAKKRIVEDYDNTNPGGTLSAEHKKYAPVYPYQARAYYLRPCSRPASVTCTDADDDGNPIPTLVKQELSDNLDVVEFPVAEGVEAMSILYGIDASPTVNGHVGDGVPEIFIPNPTDDQFTQVVAVRVTVLVRSIKPVPNHNDAGKTYDLDGDGVSDFSCIADCNYTRQVYSRTIQLRNVAQKRATQT